jgi:hypothetical protein
MAVSKKRRQLHRNRKRGDSNQIAAQLAPLEEQNRDAAQKQGASENGSNQGGKIVIDKQDLQIPKGVNEAEGASPLGIDPIVIVIVALLLAFIAFIVWQVSLMPEKP